MPFAHLKKILLAMLTLVSVANCAGPYKGRLIEAKGGDPIQGVVVVGYWTNETPTLGGGVTNCLDARETVSDEKGDFTIPTSTYGEIFGEMNVAIYKVGYERLGPGPWISLKEALILKDKVKWEDDRAIIPLKRVGKLNSPAGWPPSGGCGRRDGKPLSVFQKEREEFDRAIGVRP